MNENGVTTEQGVRQVVRRTAAEREALISEYRTSGLTQKEFARQRGIATNTFLYWLKPRKTMPVRFAQVKIAAPVQMPLEVELKNGVRIRMCCTDGRIGLADLIREVSRC